MENRQLFDHRLQERWQNSEGEIANMRHLVLGPLAVAERLGDSCADDGIRNCGSATALKPGVLPRRPHIVWLLKHELRRYTFFDS